MKSQIYGCILYITTYRLGELHNLLDLWFVKSVTGKKGSRWAGVERIKNQKPILPRQKAKRIVVMREKFLFRALKFFTNFGWDYVCLVYFPVFSSVWYIFYFLGLLSRTLLHLALHLLPLRVVTTYMEQKFILSQKNKILSCQFVYQSVIARKSDRS